VYFLPPYNTVPATMETLAFLLLVTMQWNNTGLASISMELFDYGYLVTTRVLHVNDGLRSNVSQYVDGEGHGWFHGNFVKVGHGKV
jgi:hypothetical protein